MTSRTSTVTRNTLWSVLDLAVEFTLPVVTSVLVARALGPSKLGQYGYVLWVAQMGLIVGSLGIPRAATRFLAQHVARDVQDEARAILRLSLGLQGASAALIVACGLAWVLLFVPSDEAPYASLAVASILPAAFMGMATAVNTSFENFKANVLASIAGLLANALGVVLTLLLHWDLLGLAAALLVGRSADCIMRWLLLLAHQPPGWSLLKRPQSRLSPEVRREFLAFSLDSSILLGINLVVWNRSEMLFLKYFCGFDQIAFYSLAFTFATIPNQLSQPFLRAATASMFVEQGRSARGAAHVAFLMGRYVSLLALPAAFGLAALSQSLIGLLYGPRYVQAGLVLALAAAFGFVAPLVEPATGLVSAAGGQRQLVRWGLFGALATLTLDLLLVQLQCARGAALANGLGQLVSGAGIWLIAMRRHQLQSPLVFVGSVFLAASATGVLAWAVARAMPSGLAVVAAPAIGVAFYLSLLRWMKLLDEVDARRLRAALQTLPAPLSAPGARLIGWIVPTGLSDGP